MILKPTELADVKEIVPARFGDHRGYFSEVFKDGWFRENVCHVGFVQDNQSLSREVGTLRGLHFQLEPFAQGKLVRVLNGAIFDVAVDIRSGSPDYGRWVGVTLTAEEGNQLWIPAGFAHGFLTLQPDTLIHYKVTAPYSAAHDRGLRWNDPSIGIAWPEVSAGVILSAKDEVQPFLADMEPAFRFTGK
ncbi:MULTISPECIES: dTDP-4-dehydrorhamnose 3,5-epimerase [unclassified Rhizobium]|uniref:dTDP-4-dehydrorhamnose 3,5-epimerase n=1 Tax=unclassified Rhizobium TaxID=2613769 RepID=UPI0006FDBFA7|nr:MULTISPECIES: dTDP-4-dehydrorhamnose 3,5-epimerase [unclassified Rhizobium]KQV33360.1 dTDP-4-dehydrorhamnose 3,5-epimerase [Rhizobium sp. Root1212]KRD22494.1 dTDP-4-dehydrorhamnose 3,5-epimerase [Rhizobium sp. Root268]